MLFISGNSGDMNIGNKPPLNPRASDGDTMTAEAAWMLKVEMLAGDRRVLILPSDRATLLFNGTCKTCKTIASWVFRNDEPINGGGQHLDERAIGFDPEELKKLHPGLDIWEAYRTVHIILPDGTMKEGGEAITEVLKRLPPTKWLTPFLDLEVIGWRPGQSLVNLGYFLIDQLRPVFGCGSCNMPVPWWGKPIDLIVKLWKSINGAGKEAK